MLQMCADAPNVRVFSGVILRTFGATEDLCRILDMVEVVVTLQFLLDFITMEGQEKPKENNVVYTTKKLTIDQKRKVLEIVDKMVAERPGGKKTEPSGHVFVRYGFFCFVQQQQKKNS